MQLEDLNALSLDSATTELLKCCGSKRWARLMAERRPFASLGDVAASADEVWRSLESADWLEAFSAHPRIGRVEANGAASATRAGRAGSGTGAQPDRWASAEQSGMNAATDEIRQRLTDGNREYEARFGYIFIVCATGKSAGEMLAALDHRLANAPDDELGIAAEEQRKIARLRLDKLLT